MDEQVEVVEETISPKRRRVSFDQPFDFHVANHVPCAPFLSGSTIAQGGSRKEEVRSTQSLKIERPTAVKRKMVWTKVPEKKKKEKKVK